MCYFHILIFKVNTDEEPMVFKAQLMALTGVQVTFSPFLEFLQLIPVNFIISFACLLSIIFLLVA